jgi:sulfur-oxidizing protein SoxX
LKEEAAMRISAKKTLTLASTLALVLGGFSVITGVASAADEVSPIEAGAKLVGDKKKGNCVSCHKIAGLKGKDKEAHGNIGPALVNMKARFPDKEKLRAQIYDATVLNPNTLMPPFGKHKILNKGEIDKVVEFIYTL